MAPCGQTTHTQDPQSQFVCTDARVWLRAFCPSLCVFVVVFFVCGYVCCLLRCGWVGELASQGQPSSNGPPARRTRAGARSGTPHESSAGERGGYDSLPCVLPPLACLCPPCPLPPCLPRCCRAQGHPPRSCASFCLPFAVVPLAPELRQRRRGMAPSAGTRGSGRVGALRSDGGRQEQKAPPDRSTGGEQRAGTHLQGAAGGSFFEDAMLSQS
jgi:hypothetical protein